MTSGNDTVDGTLANSVNGDIIVDSSTTDSDVANIKVSATNQAATISGVEAINLDFAGFALTFNAANVSKGTLNISTTQEYNTSAKIDGIGSSALNVKNSASITTLALDGTAGTSDATTLELAGGALALTLGNVADAIETVNLKSSVSANTVTITETQATSTYGVSGDKDLTLVGDFDTDFTADTITNSGTGVLTLKNNATMAGGTDLTKVAAGTKLDLAADSGGQIVSLAAGTHSVTLSHADAADVTLDAAGSAATDSITINLSKVKTAADALNTTDFETVNLIDTSGEAQTITAGSFGTMGAVTLQGAKDWTFATSVQAKSIDASALTGTAKIDITDADITNNGFIKGTANADSIFIEMANAETVTVTGNGGNDKVELQTLTETTVMVVTTGDGADTINAGAGNDTIISGGGNDVISTGNGDNYVVAGSGYDEVTVGTGADALNMGDGNDIVYDQAAADADAITITAADVLIGGEGTDLLYLVADAGAGYTFSSTNFLGFESIIFTEEALDKEDVALTMDDANVAAGVTFEVNASALTANKLTFDGSKETDGAFKITGSAAGADVIKTGAGADDITVIDGGATITAGKGADKITTTTGGADTIKQAAGDTGTLTAVTSGMSTVGFDVVTNLVVADSDIVDLTAIFGAGSTAAVTEYDATATLTLANSGIYYIEGAYNSVTKKFALTNGGTDTLLVYDADTTAGTSFQAVVLVGLDVDTAAVTALTAGQLILA